MSDDGADIGVRAGRALKTILGGKPSPEKSERLKDDEFEYMIRNRPTPDQMTEPVWDRTDLADDEKYSFGSECLAHAFLILAEERPELLTTQTYYPDEPPEGCSWPEDWKKHLAGKPRDLVDVMWDAYKERWPNHDDVLGGVSGFMVGWAFNAVRHIKKIPPAPNPAIMTIGNQ